MAPESQEQQNGSTDETSGQEQQAQQQATPGETPSAEQQQSGTQVTIDDSTKLPETHPLVKTLTANKAKIAEQAAALRDANAQAARVTKLEQELNERPSKESVETLQTRYDRLEAFAQAVGLGKALDSRTFTRDLFESDKDIKTLVAEWNKSNPSTTSTALGAGAGVTKDKVDPNELLRIAAGKSS